MKKLVLELRCSKALSEPGGDMHDTLGVYLWDKEGNCRELRMPEELSAFSLGYVSGFVSQWPMATEITFQNSLTAGTGYKDGHIDGINLRESYRNLSGGFLRRFWGRGKKSLKEFFWTSQPST